MNFAHGSSANNIKFKYPKAPLYLPSEDWGWTKCPDVEGGIPENKTECTQVITVNVGDIVEIRIVGAENMTSAYRRYMWTYHTAHLHGGDVYVINLGYPKVENNIIVGLNEDIKCLNEGCTKHEWNEAAILQEKDFVAPVRKNTVLIPAMGKREINKIYSLENYSNV